MTLLLACLAVCSGMGQHGPMESLFDGHSLNGWEGDTTWWRVQNGAITGGSLEVTVPHNSFLCTTRTYKDFVLRFKIRLTGEDGFINSGLQFRSKRLDNPAYEMEGYQADWGEGYWASLYDESRRNRTLMAPDSIQVKSWIRENDWNEYEVRAENNRIRLTVNGHETVNYVETDSTIPQQGLIGIQIHGGGKALVEVKEIFIRELP